MREQGIGKRRAMKPPKSSSPNGESWNPKVKGCFGKDKLPNIESFQKLCINCSIPGN
jgi:hypothetical protein